MEDIKNNDLTEYLKYLEFNRNYSVNTLTNYELDIKEYLLFLRIIIRVRVSEERLVVLKGFISI